MTSQESIAVHRILLISTGGTIAGEVAASKKDTDYEVKKAEAFSELLHSTVNHIRKDKKLQLDITPYEFAEEDSSDIKPEHWKGLVEVIRNNYDTYDSFVITHGTNTLGYTCAALSFALQNNGKPVVLTGSQVPIEVPGSDAKANLDNAIRIACWKKHPIHGVVAVFGSHIISGCRVKKSTEFDYDAFVSFGTASLGRIGRIININEENLKKHNSYMATQLVPIAWHAKQLKVDNRFESDIVSLTEFPGMNPDIFIILAKQLEIKGFVLRAFGAGDAAHSLHTALAFLKEKEIPVVITTQAPNGNANMQVNVPGQEIKEGGLAIPAYDMSIESQTAKLAWLLAKKKANEISYAQLCNLMITDMRGEVKVLFEDDWGS